MAGLTRSLITRHALDRADAYDTAPLDFAQDHLYLLVDTGPLAPRVLQIRARVLDNELGNDFNRWYPNLALHDRPAG
jgi:hypothetical protein